MRTPEIKTLIILLCSWMVAAAEPGCWDKNDRTDAERS